MEDVFALKDPTRGPADPRNRPVAMEAEAPVGPRKISDVQELITLFDEVMTEESASPDNAARYAADGHRYRIEEGTRQVEALVGKVTPGQWKSMVRLMIAKDNLGTFVQTLLQTQSNGVWVPTKWGMRRGVVPRNNRLRNVAHKLPGGSEAIGTHAEVVAVPVDVLEYRIVWTDAAGQQDMKYDAMGKVVNPQDVRVTTGLDPAVAAAMTAQAEAVTKLAGALTSKGDAQLRADAEAEVEATLTAPKRKSDGLTDEQRTALEKARATRAAKKAATVKPKP